MSDSWTWRPLGELFDIGAGKTMSAAARAGHSQVPFLRTSNVFWDRIDLTTLDEMSISAEEFETKALEPGDLLVCEGGEIGRAAIWEGGIERISFQNHLHRLRPKLEDVEPRFYVFFLQSAFTQLGIFEGAGNKTTIPNLSSSRLASLEVPKPPLHVQKAIVAALRTVRDAMTTNEKAGDMAAELKRAALVRLFEAGLRGADVRDTEIGAFPVTWETVKIRDLGTVVTGTTPPTRDPGNYQDGTIPFVAPGDFGHGDRIERTAKMLSQQGIDVSRPLAAGTTCFVCIGSTIGKVGLTSAEVCATNQQINAVVPSKAYEPRYVFYLLTYWSDYIRRHASPSPVPILSKGAFEAIDIVTSIDLAEQTEIADILEAVDRKIELHRHKRALLGELFRSLLHKVMTGEVSVDDLLLPPEQTAGSAA